MEDIKSTSEEGSVFTITKDKAFIMHVDNTSWKTCGNCYAECGRNSFFHAVCSISPWMWKPIECPFCGGPLSEIREHAGKKYRHCYACHFEFEENEKASP